MIKPDSYDLWYDIEMVRKESPLVHNITNFVTVNLVANVLLAIGAAPVMSLAIEETADMTAISKALVLNIGTLTPQIIAAMKISLKKASDMAIPVVLDPVGAGATPYRMQAINELLSVAPPTIIRGNASEIMAVAGLNVITRGVDSTAGSNQAIKAASSLADKHGCVVCISGAIDHIIDNKNRHAELANGHELMTKITGMGCGASAMIAAFAAVQSDPWRATLACMAYLGIVGELAIKKALTSGHGIATMQIMIIDLLQQLSFSEFQNTLKLSYN